MKILRVKKTKQFDIFLGKEWNGWSRYEIHSHGHYKYIDGKTLPRHLIEKVKQQVCNLI